MARNSITFCHGGVELVIGAGGDLPGVPGLKIAEPLFSLADAIGIETSPSSLAVEGDPRVETAAGFTDVKSGGSGGLPFGCFLSHGVAA
jgi:hypothetical protein